MKLAIMQPYFFPYIGYFQLIATVDKFVIYDDVNFINKGWINRNNILVNGKAHMITVPLDGASQNKRINEVDILDDNKWKLRILKTIKQSYSKAPYFDSTCNLIETVFEKNRKKISVLNIDGILTICEYLDIKTEIIKDSERYKNNHLKGQNRILDICIKEKATSYINPSGGLELYDYTAFQKMGIKLSFSNSELNPYKQFTNDFLPALSILDVLMFNSKDNIKLMLENYKLNENRSLQL